MLRSLKDLEGYGVQATDGSLGSVANFLLDDQSWVCRYLVVHAGNFFKERDVLISPMFFRKLDWSERLFHLALTREKIRESPGAETDLPISRQHERDYYRYYGYPNYWGSTGVWGFNSAPVPVDIGEGPVEPPSDEDPHLRSAKDIRGYHLRGSDGEVGHVEDFILDDATWQIRYLVVNTSNWWLGDLVLVSPIWADRISWEEHMVYLDLSRKQIKGCPPWNAATGVNRAYEETLFDYYGRPVYWDSPDSEADRRDQIL